MIEIMHNFEPGAFVWLWAKYVTGFNPKYHCTNSIRGRYSRKLSKHNENLTESKAILMDELPQDSYRAIYICGVARQGYARKQNYPHNVHAALEPCSGAVDLWRFENWRLEVRGGRFLHIPATEFEIPSSFKGLPPAYTSCRIFRWAAYYFDSA
jgi:hypothetical protein